MFYPLCIAHNAIVITTLKHYWDKFRYPPSVLSNFCATSLQINVFASVINDGLCILSLIILNYGITICLQYRLWKDTVFSFLEVLMEGFIYIKFSSIRFCSLKNCPQANHFIIRETRKANTFLHS